MAVGNIRAGLDAVHAVGALVPEVPQILAFDTAFHATLPPPARTFALPRELVAQGIRPFGFHGLSYQSVAGQLPAHLGVVADGRVFVAHLGSGASCAPFSAGGAWPPRWA
jgi:acetate kinase